MEVYGWGPEYTLSKPWAEIVEILEARAQRLERGRQKQNDPFESEGANVTYTDNLAELGIGVR